MDEDFLLATQLQEQFNSEYETSLFSSNGFQDNNAHEGFGQSSKKRRVEDVFGGSGGGGGGTSSGVVPYWKPTPRTDRPLSIVDESWETLDPNPDVRAMFLEFNETFFWGKLCGVEVRWSPRMTLCAGVCSYEGRGGLCSIRLSEPLLKLRPRKDLVETLLHEMIHALLFVTQNNRDRDGHGPEFHKHMNRINTATGTKISVYHSFQDEVDVYRTHWWKCDGPCQHRGPHFGLVKRATNRAPSPQDFWWGGHQSSCGGTFLKFKEPEGYGKKGKKGGKKDGNGAVKKKAPGKPGTAKPSSAITGSASSSASASVSGSQDIRNFIPFGGRGFLLGGKSPVTSPPPSFTPPHRSPISSPKKLFSPTSSPPLTSLKNKGTSSNIPSMKPTTSTGPKPPVKRSVGNTRAFININGSPVRIDRSKRSTDQTQNLKQKSLGDLFNNMNNRRPLSQSSSSNTDTKIDSASNLPSRTSQSSPSKACTWSNSSVGSSKTNGSDFKPTQSKFFTPSNSDSASGAGPNSRKRSWDEQSGSSSSSAAIFDSFQKTLANDKAAYRDSPKAKLPTVQQRTATATATSSSGSSVLPTRGPNTFNPSSSSSSASASSSSAAIMVSCPVCQIKVQESAINAHLDSCLS